MLLAALHAETGLQQQQQHLTDNCSVSASVSGDQTHARPTNVVHNPAAVSKQFTDTRMQCSDNVTTVTMSTDPASAFWLSQDDFDDDDIGDLSFIDLPLHSESSHGVKLSAATSQEAAVAVATGKTSLSVFADIISPCNHPQSPNNNCLMNMHDAVNAESAQNAQNSFVTAVNFASQNGILCYLLLLNLVFPFQISGLY